MLHIRYFKTAAILTAALMFMTAVNIYAGVIKAEKIKAEVERYVLENYDNIHDEFEVKVINAKDIEINDIDNKSINISHNPDRIHNGNMPITVSILNGAGKVVKRARLIARVKSFSKAAVINRNIKRGEIIGPDDIVIERTDVTRLKDFYKSKSELDGMQAKKTLKTGAVLTGTNVCPVYVVRRGDKVKIEIRAGDVFVSAEGTAKENGGYGEYIKVYVEMTKSTIACKIINSKTVVLGDV